MRQDNNSASGSVNKSAQSAAGAASAAGKCNVPAILACVVMVLCIGSDYLLLGNYINSVNPYATVVIAQICVFLIPCAFFSVFSGTHALKNYKFRPFSPKMTGFVLSCLPMLVLGSMLIKYLGYIYLGTSGSATISASGSGDFLYILLSTVLVPAICEELLLRGIVFTEYEKRLGAFGAILGSSLLFAFIHFDIQNFFSYFYAGIILGIAVHTTRSLLVPIILHLLNNFICIYSDTFLQKISKESISTVFVLFLFGVMMLISLFLFFESLEWICEYKAERLTSHDTPASDEIARLLPSKGKLTSTISKVIFAPAFFVSTAIYIIGIILIRQ